MASARQTAKDRKDHAHRVCKALERAYPDAECALTHANPYQLLVATILSAQCTDVACEHGHARALSPLSRLRGSGKGRPERARRSDSVDGILPRKTRSLLAMAKKVVQDHRGTIPRELDQLTELPGVGRKTANVVLGTAFGIASGVVVDTHVKRLRAGSGSARRRHPSKSSKT